MWISFIFQSYSAFGVQKTTLALIQLAQIGSHGNFPRCCYRKLLLRLCKSTAHVNPSLMLTSSDTWIGFPCELHLACDFHFLFSIVFVPDTCQKSLEGASNSARPDSSARVNSYSPRDVCSCWLAPGQILLSMWICTCLSQPIESVGSASNSAPADSSAHVISCSSRFVCSCEIMPAQILLSVWIYI